MAKTKKILIPEQPLEPAEPRTEETPIINEVNVSETQEVPIIGEVKIEEPLEEVVPIEEPKVEEVKVEVPIIEEPKTEEVQHFNNVSFESNEKILVDKKLLGKLAVSIIKDKAHNMKSVAGVRFFGSLIGLTNYKDCLAFYQELKKGFGG